MFTSIPGVCLCKQQQQKSSANTLLLWICTGFIKCVGKSRIMSQTPRLPWVHRQYNEMDDKCMPGAWM